MLTWLTWFGLALAIFGLLFGFGFLYVSSRKEGSKAYYITGWIFFSLGVVGIILILVGLLLNDSVTTLQPGQTIYYQSNQIVNTSNNSDIVVVDVGGVITNIGVSNNSVTTETNVVIVTSNLGLKYVVTLTNNSSSSFTVSVYPGNNSSLTWSGPFTAII